MSGSGAAEATGITGRGRFPIDGSVGRLVLLLGLMFGLESTLFSCISPLLPHFAHSLGLSKSATGLLTGAYPAGVTVGALVAGRLRHLNPRSITLVGMIIFTGATFLFGFAHSASLLEVARLVEGLGCGGIWPGGLAWLAKAVPAENRGRSLGIAMGTATAGAMVGPLLGTLAAAVGLPVVFGVMGGVSVVASMAIAVTPAPEGGLSHAASLLGFVRNRRLAVSVYLLAFPFAGGGLLLVLIPLQLSPKGGAGVEVGVTFFVASAIGTVLCVVAGRISDRRGAMLPIRAGMIASTPLAVLVALTRSVPVVIVCTIGYLAVAYSFLATPTMALITDAVHGTEYEAAAPAVQLLSMAVGTLVGSWGGAAAAQAIGNTAMYATLAGLGVATFALLHVTAGTAPTLEPLPSVES